MNRFKTLFLSVFCLFFFSSLHAEAILTNIDGKRIPLSSLKGKWVMINFWASWCHPCIDEIPELNAFYNSHKKKVALFAVNYDGPSVKAQRALIKKAGIEYPSLAKNPIRQLGLGALQGVPATFIFDPQGHYYDTLYGGVTQRALNKIIRG